MGEMMGTGNGVEGLRGSWLEKGAGWGTGRRRAFLAGSKSVKDHSGKELIKGGDADLEGKKTQFCRIFHLKEDLEGITRLTERRF
jgi:hypothetical protein